MGYTPKHIAENSIVQDFNETVAIDFRNGNIDLEDFYSYIHEYIETLVIYTSDAKDYIKNLDYDIFQEHELGQANSYEQAAFCAIYDVIMEHEDTLTEEKLRRL